VIAPNRGATGIVYWTKHEEDIEEIEKQLPQHMADFSPAFLLCLKDKHHLAADPVRLAAAIRQKTAALPGQSILWEWEHIVHNAATRTTDLILQQSHTGGTDVLSLLCALIKASAGKAAIEDNSRLSHLYEALNPLHYDQLEQASRLTRCSHEVAQALRDAMDRKAALKAEHKASLNRALLVADIPPGKACPVPGSVYIGTPAKKCQCPVTRCRLTSAIVDEWTPQGSSWPNWVTDANYKALNKASDGDPDMTTARDSRKAAILAECHAALVEVTPSCDYAQAKTGTARFLAGILVPEQHVPIFRVQPHDRLYLKELPGIEVGTLKGPWHLILNARFLYSIPNPVRRVSSRPLLRLRNHVLVDIQAWFAAHAARPGYLSV